ncbi:MAG: GTPase HflX [Candidatus Thermoplasmatota archaeon]|nr:GTPase HflX [Candidatus Thermoplasmatota archaeon]
MKKGSTKYAIIVSLHDDVEEIQFLAESNGFEIIELFIQHREKPDVTSYIGTGKKDEINTFTEDSDVEINAIIIDGTLKPSQWFLLEKHWGIPVYDRLRLILMIFKDRADRKEARLQVRLAELQYERPFVKELIHRARSGEHPGLMAGGEYQVDDYYEMIKRQIRQIKEDLDQIRNQRKVRRQHRHHSGYYLVSLAGYTNAGKSSLLNVLTNDNIVVENKLFSTLSTTTRKLSQSSIPILMTDTVGFIQQLPAWIIEAFHSTLEEIKAADVVVLTVDISDSFPVFKQKVRTSFDELSALDVQSPVIIALNKMDLVEIEEIKEKESFINEFCMGKTFDLVSISIHKQKNLDKLQKKIIDILPQLYQLEILLPNNEETQSFLSWIHDYSKCERIIYGSEVHLIVTAHQQIKEKIISKVKKFKGTLVMEKQI